MQQKLLLMQMAIDLNVPAATIERGGGVSLYSIVIFRMGIFHELGGGHDPLAAPPEPTTDLLNL